MSEIVVAKTYIIDIYNQLNLKAWFDATGNCNCFETIVCALVAHVRMNIYS